MLKKISFRITVLVIVLPCLFASAVTIIKASSQIWSLQSTSDCSGYGGNGETFDNLCYNQNGVNSTIPWIHSSDPAIHFDVIVGHTYEFSETTNFIGVGGDFIANFLTDGQGKDYGSGDDWICPTAKCSHGGWAKTFTATSKDLYFAQGSGCSSSTSCYTTNLLLNDLSIADSPTPTPTPTETPTPTPSPTSTPTPSPTPSPLPVTKTVFVPGFGGSWDTSSILSCQYDPNATWGLAPFAESVYNPLLTTLVPSDWSVIPFYYDWRQPVTQNGTLLKQKVDSLNEKVNLVGHSMGGLVGRAYLEEEFDSNKISSFLTVGSPHRGVAIAYPAWGGGEIWTDNFLAKIATTLYLKLCGQKGPLSNNRETLQNIFPSFRDLLPIDPYLVSTRNFSPPNINDVDMNAKNVWLVGDTKWPISNIKLGSLSGSGFATLQNIPVKEPSNRDISLGNWTDGKPAGKIYSTSGDGTVLTSSSDINDPAVEFHPIISQTHSGLVASNNGLNQIREFLGLSQIVATSSTFSEPTSALILIGYPAKFWIADQKGNIVKDKNGMVAIMNPKSGIFKISLSPKSGNTRFIIAQFLANGDVKYKEYSFKGFANQFKTLKFDINNPQEDILN